MVLPFSSQAHPPVLLSFSSSLLFPPPILRDWHIGSGAADLIRYGLSDLDARSLGGVTDMET